MSAPSSSSCSRVGHRVSGRRNAPPSLNESGVIFTTPITSVRRPNSMVRVRNRQFAVLFISAHSDGTLWDWCLEQNQNSRAQANKFYGGSPIPVEFLDRAMWRFLKGKRHLTASVPLYTNCRTAMGRRPLNRNPTGNLNEYPQKVSGAYRRAATAVHMPDSDGLKSGGGLMRRRSVSASMPAQWAPPVRQ